MKSLKEWLDEGENLYSQAMAEFTDLERQMSELETRLAEKKEEVNQIATVIGKPPIGQTRADAAKVERMGQVQLMDRDIGSVPASRQTIAKVLAGKSI